MFTRFPVLARLSSLALGLASSTASAFAAEPVGRVDLRLHDPSTLVRGEDGDWWLFATGRQIVGAHSPDLKHWKYQDPILAEPPSWAIEIAPGNKKHHYWAPDLIRSGHQWLLYYSVSEFGKNTSAIALATSPTLDPKSPDYKWTDRGVVIRSGKGKDYNAIDPAMLLDDGRLWMSFGSFWGGIFIFELDPKTGLRLEPDKEPLQIAWAREIEAPTLYRRGEYYYLFVNHGLCCKGKDSTYRLLVGRSKSITGPYVDDQGKDLMQSGGRAVLATQGDFIGPGHIGLLEDKGQEWASMHFYDGTRNGQPTFALRKLRWTDDGWPEIAD